MHTEPNQMTHSMPSIYNTYNRNLKGSKSQIVFVYVTCFFGSLFVCFLDIFGHYDIWRENEVAHADCHDVWRLFIFIPNRGANRSKLSLTVWGISFKNPRKYPIIPKKISKSRNTSKNSKNVWHNFRTCCPSYQTR